MFDTLSKFDDLRGKDISHLNLKHVPVELLLTLTFDTLTKWPKHEKLPPYFNPYTVLEDGKNPGLGIRDLHASGITGKGVYVAILDQTLDLNHPEYASAIADHESFEIQKIDEISMHGPAVTSLLVGKECGVAPDAKLVYRACSTGNSKDMYLSYINALHSIIERNTHCHTEKRVRVVSVSLGYQRFPYLKQWKEVKKKAFRHGVYVIDANEGDALAHFTKGGAPNNKDNFNSYQPSLYNTTTSEIDLALQYGDVDEAVRLMLLDRPELHELFTESKLREEAEAFMHIMKVQVLAPSDYRTMASSWNGLNQYMYTGRGGISWSVPYVAGVFALGLQLRPKLTIEQFANAVHSTAVVNSKNLRIINPPKILNEVMKL